MGGLVGGVVGSVGGLISGGKAADAAKGQAEALRAAADKASAMAQFNPYGMTTAFGTSAFEDGKGSYTLSPQLKAIQDRLFSQTAAYDPNQIAQAAQPLYGGASTLFSRAADYLGQSPEQVSAKYMADQQALLQPSRAADLARLQTTNFGRGTGGLAVNTGTGGGASNPLAQALFNAQAKQDLQLAAQADQAAMDRAKFGAGLFGTGGSLLAQVPALQTAGYDPLRTQLGLLGTTETMGQQPFLLSQDLAQKYAQAGAQAGQLYLQPQAAAAQAYSKYQGYSPMGTFIQGIGNSIANWQGGGTTNPYANMGMSGNDQSGYTYDQQVGPTQSGGNLASSGMGGSGLFGGMSSWFSDIRTKENIKLVGKMKNGLNLYEYEYKPEFKDHELAGHGKFIGVMAHEVEKVMPHAVKVMANGYKAVNYGVL